MVPSGAMKHLAGVLRCQGEPVGAPGASIRARLDRIDVQLLLVQNSTFDTCQVQ